MHLDLSLTLTKIFHGFTLSNTIILVFLSFLLILYNLKQRKIKKGKGYNSIPGPGQYFLGGLGNLWKLKNPRAVMKLMEGLCVKYGPIFRADMISHEIVFLNSPEYVQILYGSKDPNHGAKGFAYNTLKPLVRDGLLLSTGEKWKTRRKVLNKHMFSFKTLQSYMKIVNSENDTLVTALGKFATAGNEMGKPLNEIVEASVLNIVTQITLGKNATDFKKFEETNLTFAEMINGAKNLISKKVLEPWWQVDQLWRFNSLSKLEKEISEFSAKHVMNSLVNDVTTDGLGIKKDLLTDGISLDGVKEEVLTMIDGGYETTVTALQIFFFLLALHPHHQELCRQEADSVFENEDSCTSQGHLEYGALSKLKYIEMCMNEAFRLLPTAFFSMRCIEAPIKLDENIELPSGTQVAVFTPGIHKNPKYFPDPEKFIPERFSPEEIKNRSPFAFLPFSTGPRSCIGYKLATMEILCFTARILRNYKIYTTDRLEDVVFLPNLTLTPEKPFNFIIRRRAAGPYQNT